MNRDRTMPEEPVDGSDPILLYLDQSDWSYLESGRFPAAEQRLRALSQAKVVALLISPEHMVETAGLLSGRRSRIAYLRSYPTAMWIELPANEILRRSVAGLLAAAQGQPVPSYVYTAGPLCRYSTDEILGAVRWLRILRFFYRMVACAEAASRRTRTGWTRKRLKSHDRFFGAFLRGEDLSDDAYLRGLGNTSRIGRWIMQLASAAVSAGSSALASTGLTVVPNKAYDETFLSAVFPYLPLEVRRSPDVVGRLQAIWRDPKRRAQVAPHAACVAAVVEAIYSNTDYTVTHRDVADQNHVAFAPIVDVFTCDKRNVDPVSRILRLGGYRTRVLRSQSLDQVVSELDERLSKEEEE